MHPTEMFMLGQTPTGEQVTKAATTSAVALVGMAIAGGIGFLVGTWIASAYPGEVTCDTCDEQRR